MPGIAGLLATLARTPDPAAVARWVKLFSVVASLLGAFLLLVILLSLLRRRRAVSAAARRSAGAPIADAWGEAGRRAAPYDDGADPRGADDA